MTEPKIKIENLYKIFGSNPKKHLPKVQHGMSKDDLLDTHNHVLGVHNVSLDIMPRQIQVVMGLSGSGKSTLIRHINRLIEPTGGEIFIDGEDVLAMNADQLRDLRRHKMSMVFQKFGLLPHRSVRENVAYGLAVQGIDEVERNKRSAHWIDRVGLSGYEDHYPGQLSGGMQQRVGLARGLATDADILLMDEAFSALDPLIRYDMQSILLELQEELHKTIVFITHDLDEALRLGDNIAILRDGAMVQEGNAQQIVLNPADDYIRDFIKDINRGRVIQLHAIANAAALTSAPEDAPQLAGNTVLEDALPVMAEAADQTVKVTASDGRVVGAVSLTSAIQALHS
ncbi:glycine betaine/L-proline ABC transporter ATP-binding protein [Thalassobius sp. Cn5-15]|uniref:quaternary amine ABC transporter ATP-binding protein n=1 Tax=Thalassobius sp. Cn5-15 TaxID=2917763 RepID=UPI001EF33590|nr:glycine betaine/L-proline ABC transporter ATP-binding protein [Thalassobius sp. Cn5-15]MCG7493069.1 glycine betaine/L-proline ABC transporter ATP-binding protein [Thalassobius sp. Cn5-15]